MNPQAHQQSTDFGDESILKALSRSSEPTAIYSGEDMMIRFANQGMLNLWGKDSSVIGKPLMQALPELEGQPFLSLLQQVWRTGESYSVSDAPAKLLKNGMEVTDYFDYEYKALLGSDHQTWCILNTASEVTGRREYMQSIQQKEEKEQALLEEMAATMEELTATNEDLTISLKLLAQSREHVRTIIEQAPVGIAMLEGPELRIELANPAILKIWDHQLSDIQGLPHGYARPELTGQPVNGWLEEVFKTGKRKTNNELTVLLKKGKGLREAVVNSVYQPVFSAKGEVEGVLVILDEITESVLQRRKNEKDQHMLSMAIEAGELATFYYEMETNHFSGNALLKHWFGLLDQETLPLETAISAIHEDDRARVTEAISSVLSEESDGHYFIEYRILHPQDPGWRLVQASGKTFFSSEGKPASLLGTLRDITEQKKEEQRKNDFMGMVSHELKTPLTSITAFIQLMQQRAMQLEDSQGQAILQKTLKQVRNMNSMINGFLNISRLDSGRMLIEKTKFDLNDLFAELEEELLSTVHTHRINVKRPFSCRISADRNKISQVIQNLVGNAVKYSPVGKSITLNYSLAQGQVNITVQDEGMGIAPEDLEQIFERYYRVKGNQMGSIAGFGIGLYLCREIIDMHQGHIHVESSPGNGSTFIVRIPSGEAT